MEEGVKMLEDGFPSKEIEGIKRRLTIIDSIENYIPLGKSLYSFFYLTSFFIFLFLGLSIISVYQTIWVYHINRYVRKHMKEQGVQMENKGFLGNTVLDIVSHLISKENLLNYNQMKQKKLTSNLEIFVILFAVQILLIFVGCIYLRHVLETFWAKKSKLV